MTTTTYKPFDESKMMFKLKKVGWAPEIIDKYIDVLKRDNKQFILDVVKEGK